MQSAVARLQQAHFVSETTALGALKKLWVLVHFSLGFWFSLVLVWFVFFVLVFVVVLLAEARTSSKLQQKKSKNLIFLPMHGFIFFCLYNLNVLSECLVNGI